jgi:putative membrane protein
MGLIPVIVIAMAIYLIVQAQRGGSSRETPLETLNKRYAKGEISKEEYDQMKRDLSR